MALRSRPLFVLLLALFMIVGCGSDELNSPTAKRLKGLATVYLDLAVVKNGKGPANERELKVHMKALPDFVLRPSGVDPEAIDSSFASLRDNEPFVVLYNVGIGGLSATEGPVVAHEKTGKNGMRLVVMANCKVALVDEAKLKEMISAKK